MSTAPSFSHVPSVGPMIRNSVPYHSVGLLQKIEDICLPSHFPWHETLCITSSTSLDAFSAEDDLKREAAFYKSTVAGVKQALHQLENVGIPYKRPGDFLAEMIKTDEHMAKVKSKLLDEKERMEVVAERKRSAETKKFMKQTRANALQAKEKQKKETLEKVKKWKKGITFIFWWKYADHNPDDEKDLPDFDEKPKSVLGKRATSTRDHEPYQNRKRQAKNLKFGLGGKKRGLTKNDKSSAADDSQFSRFNAKSQSKGRVGAKGGAKKVGKRPGKAQRHKGRK